MNDKYRINTKKYHVFATMGIFQLESIYLYFPPYLYIKIAGTTVENKGKLILKYRIVEKSSNKLGFWKNNNWKQRLCPI